MVTLAVKSKYILNFYYVTLNITVEFLVFVVFKSLFLYVIPYYKELGLFGMAYSDLEKGMGSGPGTSC